MRKVVYIIPGFTHSTTAKEYEAVARPFEIKEIKPILVDIDWKHKTMSDYVDEFLSKLEHNKKDEVYLFGFSWGAIIALISTPKIKPKKLILCSLSPYFKEDLPYHKKHWLKFIGKKRIADFKKYSFIRIAKNINCATILLAGQKECQKYKRLKFRVSEANKKIKNSKLIIIPNAKHDIGQKEYLEAIKNVIEKL